MCFKPDRTERRQQARRRLRERPKVPPTHATHPRSNASIDQRDLQRSLERLETVIGR
jgi:hypothetical protein